MARIRLFAGAREAAGTGTDEIPGRTVAQVLDGAVGRYGADFAEVLSISRVWLNGEPAARDDRVVDSDEVAVLPPVSGGAGTVDPGLTAGAGRGDPAPTAGAGRGDPARTAGAWPGSGL